MMKKSSTETAPNGRTPPKNTTTLEAMYLDDDWGDDVEVDE
jgi:hypothetical protein